MQVFKWGESLAVCLPSAVVQALDLREGDCLQAGAWTGTRPMKELEQAIASLTIRNPFRAA